MKERPILFSGPMVRAIIEGRKTQTRRVIKPQPQWEEDPCHCDDGAWRGRYRGLVGDGSDWDVFVDEAGPCPFGQPGDILWAKETWRKYDGADECACYEDCHCPPTGTVIYRADCDHEARWRSPIFMPKQHCRLWLRVTGVRVERLQDISRGDAWAEGIDTAEVIRVPSSDAEIAVFSRVWDSINAKRGSGWETNPWVWVVGFARVAK